MSNLNNTSDKIKKKLSLQDYKQSTDKADDIAIQEDAVKQISTDMMVQHVEQQANSDKSTDKKKATFYLGRDEIEMLMKMYIDELKKNRGLTSQHLFVERFAYYMSSM